jgi:hypothetical protein
MNCQHPIAKDVSHSHIVSKYRVFNDNAYIGERWYCGSCAVEKKAQNYTLKLVEDGTPKQYVDPDKDEWPTSENPTRCCDVRIPRGLVRPGYEKGLEIPESISVCLANAINHIIFAATRRDTAELINARECLKREIARREKADA